MSKLEERYEEFINAFSDSYASDKLKAFATTALVFKYNFSRTDARKCVESNSNAINVLKVFAEEMEAIDLGIDALLDELELINRTKEMVDKLVYNLFD